MEHHLIPDRCQGCHHRPVVEITYRRTTDDAGQGRSRQVCRVHLAAALEETATDLLDGRINTLSVLPAPGRVPCPECRRNPVMDLAYARRGDPARMARLDRLCPAHVPAMITRRAQELSDGACTHLLVMPSEAQQDASLESAR